LALSDDSSDEEEDADVEDVYKVLDGWVHELDPYNNDDEPEELTKHQLQKNKRDSTNNDNNNDSTSVGQLSTKESLCVLEQEFQAAIHEIQEAEKARDEENFPDLFDDDELYANWRQENAAYYTKMEKLFESYPRNDKYDLDEMTEIFSKEEGDNKFLLPTIMSVYSNNEGSGNSLKREGEDAYD